MKTSLLNHIIHIAAIAVMAAPCSLMAQKKYSEIYYSLPDLTFDQRYTELMHFQASNPYFANTYVQLGIVSENKMTLTDPLRDIESTQYWAGNAKLFLGNFFAFYKDGDARSNAEFYANLNIPHAGNKLQDAEVKQFVEQHLKRCTNFMDSTLLAYKAIEKSKRHYNKCIATFRTICNNYVNMNEALLRNDKQLDATLAQLGSDIDACVEAFAEYKKILKAFPILNYRQLYEFKTIETFRLDGLTNSDFYSNRFTMWDYRKWIDEYNKTLHDDILPLRAKVEQIQKAYNGLRNSYAVASGAAGTAPLFDDLFVFQLGRYDNNSLVRELFAYLEQSRQLMALASDTILGTADTIPELMGRKMRHIFRMESQRKQTLASLGNAMAAVDADKVRRFADFFAQYYGGAEGLKKLSTTETAFANKVFADALNALATYRTNVAELHSAHTYSAKSGKWAALPLWEVADYEEAEVTGNYITTHVAYAANGQASYVAGKKRNGNSYFVAKVSAVGATEWIKDLPKTQAIRCLASLSDGCLVAVTRNNLPEGIMMSNAGKELRPFYCAEGAVAAIEHNEISQRTYMATNEGGGGVSYCQSDSLGAKAWDVAVPQFTAAAHIAEVSDGTLLFGYNGSSLVVAQVSPDGEIRNTNTLAEGVKIDALYRASAQEICLFGSDASGAQRLIVVSDKGTLVE